MKYELQLLSNLEMSQNCSRSIDKNILSEDVIPAIKGQFYSYSADFSLDRPLYFLMSCKSNKGRPITEDVKYIIQELNLCFIFGNQVTICSPNSEESILLLKNSEVHHENLSYSEIRVSSISKDTFYYCYQKKEESLLVDIYDTANENVSNIILSTGTILSVKTASGKYGLILIKELTNSTCKVDSCHILL